MDVGKGVGWSREAAETCPVVVLNDDGHYLSSLQYALRDGGGDPADRPQGALLQMRQCLAGHGGDRAGQAYRRFSADASPGPATAGAGRTDAAASRSGTPSGSGAASRSA